MDEATVDFVSGEVTHRRWYWLTVDYARRGGFLYSRLYRTCGSIGRWYKAKDGPRQPSLSTHHDAPPTASQEH